MDAKHPEFLCGIELECQSFLEDGPAAGAPARSGTGVLERLARAHFLAAPALAGRTGFFNAYGRVYLDWGHYELATAECASPYDVPGVLERQELLLAGSLAALRREGLSLRLANNNHSGLLDRHAATWGAHESYLVEVDPIRFGQAILPFLCTRLYAGAGGVVARDASFVAGVRSLFMHLDEGGMSTSLRAIHSTCRNESLMGPERRRFRYHLLLGDGQRSHFATALKLGATMLALRAALSDPRLPARVSAVGYRPHAGPRGHLALLSLLNVLALPGRPPQARPLAVRVQRVYLEAAEDWAAARPDVPAWVERCLGDWRATLEALERGDLDWLRARLDAFAKHALFESVLEAEGLTWERLAGHRQGLALLGLLDHDYHELGRPDGLLRRLELSGLLHHRVSPPLEPGEEPEPHVTALGTRADARARLLRDHAHHPGLVCDWAFVADPDLRRWSRLDDPFALAAGPWETLSELQLARLLTCAELPRPDIEDRSGARPSAGAAASTPEGSCGAPPS